MTPIFCAKFSITVLSFSFISKWNYKFGYYSPFMHSKSKQLFETKIVSFDQYRISDIFKTTKFQRAFNAKSDWYYDKKSREVAFALASWQFCYYCFAPKYRLLLFNLNQISETYPVRAGSPQFVLFVMSLSLKWFCKSVCKCKARQMDGTLADTLFHFTRHES